MMDKPRRPGRPVDAALVTRKRETLLRATMEILVEEGLAGVTFKAVADRAGEYKDSVRYYFESKAGLLFALVQRLSPSAIPSTVALPERDRLRALLAVWNESWASRDNAVAFVEILPLVIRDPALREQMAEHYRDYQPGADQFFPFVDKSDEARLRCLTVILSAVIDGVALQSLFDPDHVDVQATYDVFAEMVEAYAAR